MYVGLFVLQDWSVFFFLLLHAVNTKSIQILQEGPASRQVYFRVIQLGSINHYESAVNCEFHLLWCK